jgi:hypothetical protein
MTVILNVRCLAGSYSESVVHDIHDFNSECVVHGCHGANSESVIHDRRDANSKSDAQDNYDSTYVCVGTTCTELILNMWCMAAMVLVLHVFGPGAYFPEVILIWYESDQSCMTFYFDKSVNNTCKFLQLLIIHQHLL